jgi:NADP-dependent 3-hydroxy acid dehydrogenase YdfG
LITGASTGIGLATAIHLDNLGYKVYAGVRKDEDKENLLANAKNGLTPVMLDVCDQASIGKTFRMISEKPKGGPFHLINNAGLSVNGPLELMDYSDIKKVIDVNPKSQYLIGPGARKMSVLGKFPAKMRDKILYKAIYK